MVFPSISETHTGTRTTQSHTNSDTTNATNTHILMASSTVKPHQPLHNFPLQDLKWSMNQTTTTHHRFRSSKSPHRETAADSDAEARIDKKSDAAADGSDKKSKIFIRLRTSKSGSSSSKCVTHDEDEDVGAGAGSADDAPGVDHHDPTAAAVVALVAEDAEESVPKTWNLRPRRAVTNINNNKVGGSNGSNGGALKISGAGALDIKIQTPPSSNRSELTRSNRNGNDANANGNDCNNNKKKEKEKEKRMMSLSVPLTKEEIEEDIYSLTGSKPARRPKKRAKHVQKQLDCLFPGLWLVSITADCYKVPEAPSKG